MEGLEVLKLAVQIIYVLICIALTFIVLKQEGKGSGLTGALTGSNETYWSKNKGRSAEGTMERVTKILAAAFILVSVLLNLKFWK